MFMLLIYFLCQGIYMKLILKALNHKITITRGIFYSLVEFFFSGITPSSTGGQPAQLFYMTKDKIPMRKSYITLLLNTIYFKSILLVLGVGVLLCHSSYIINSSFIYRLFFILGISMDLAVVIFGFMLLYKTKWIKKLYLSLVYFANKLKIKKNKIDKKDVDSVLKKYKDEVVFVKSHKRLVFITFLITFIQRIILFSIIYVIYRSLGFNKLTYFDLFAIQIIVQITIESVPLPGGVGISEGMLHGLFVMIFASKMADVGMLLTRTFTFYIPLIISGLVILFEFIYRKYKSNKKYIL